MSIPSPRENIQNTGQTVQVNVYQGQNISASNPLPAVLTKSNLFPSILAEEVLETNQYAQASHFASAAASSAPELGSHSSSERASHTCTATEGPKNQHALH